MITPDLTPIFQRIADLDAAAAHTDLARKGGGITYTPPAIARAMVTLAQPQPHEILHEPACGRGVFVFALVEHWLRQGRDLAWVDRWAQEYLRCGDLDADAVADLRRLWLDFFAQQGHTAHPLQAQVEDGLFGPQAQQPVDLILGNPPYVRIQHLPPATRDALRARYPSCAKGNVDLYYAFFEDALQRAKRVAYIMPNSWLGNASAQRLRQAALPHLTHLLDFGSRLIFAPVRAYTAIVVAQREATGPIQVRSALPDEGGDWIPRARTDACWSLQRFTPLHLEGAPSGPVLGDTAEVVSGIATLADHAFVLPDPELFQRAGETWVRQRDPLEDTWTLEVPARYAPRLIKATKLDVPPGLKGPRILCPYDSDWAIVEEGRLQREAPDLLTWLGRRRGVLDQRDKGKTEGYDAWYAYGRRQGFWTPRPEDRTVVVMPQMGNGALRGVTVDLDAVGGRFLFTSGYVIRGQAGHPFVASRVIQQLASPAAWAFVKREGKAWAGAGDYMTIGARAMRRLPTA